MEKLVSRNDSDAEDSMTSNPIKLTDSGAKGRRESKQLDKSLKSRKSQERQPEFKKLKSEAPSKSYHAGIKRNQSQMSLGSENASQGSE